MSSNIKGTKLYCFTFQAIEQKIYDMYRQFENGKYLPDQGLEHLCIAESFPILQLFININ